MICGPHFPDGCKCEEGETCLSCENFTLEAKLKSLELQVVGLRNIVEESHTALEMHSSCCTKENCHIEEVLEDSATLGQSVIDRAVSEAVKESEAYASREFAQAVNESQRAETAESSLAESVTRVAELEALAKKTVGFCVNLRETKPCWEDHPDAGLLFSFVTETLKDGTPALDSKIAEAKASAVGDILQRIGKAGGFAPQMYASPEEFQDAMVKEVEALRAKGDNNDSSRK